MNMHTTLFVAPRQCSACALPWESSQRRSRQKVKGTIDNAADDRPVSDGADQWLRRPCCDTTTGEVRSTNADGAWTPKGKPPRDGN